MRVAYLCGTYPAISHTFIMREVEALRAAGVHVQTFSVRRPGEDELLTDADRRAAAETPSIQPPDPAEVVRAHLLALVRAPRAYAGALRLAMQLSPPGLRARLWHVFYFAEAIVLWSWCRERDIRHLHAHFANAASVVCLLCAAYGERDGWTWSFTMHGQYEFDDVLLYRLREKIRLSRFVACISDYARAQMMRWSPTEDWPKLAVVRCGIDTSVYVPEDRAVGDRGSVRLLTVNRLVPGKGLPLLLEAVAALRGERLPVTLTLVGDGPERPALERQVRQLGIAEATTFTGAVGQDRIREHYRNADMFCLPSFAEGIPVVLMEAMATELPVVGTRVMGIPELVEHGESGLLVRPARVDELTDALRALATDADLRRRLGAAGRRRILEHYDVRREAVTLRALFQGRRVEPDDGKLRAAA